MWGRSRLLPREPANTGLPAATEMGKHDVAGISRDSWLCTVEREPNVNV